MRNTRGLVIRHQFKMFPSRPSTPLLFPRISTAYIEGAARSVRHRQQECHKLQRALVEAKSLITNALQDDNGYSEAEALFEYGLTLLELRQTYETINLEAENASARAIEEGHDNPQRVNSAGVVYIIPARSKSSLYCVLSPLGAATAAGNCVIVEASARRGPKERTWNWTTDEDHRC